VWWAVLQETEHVFCRLAEIGFAGELGKWDSLGEKVDLEDVFFGQGGRKVAAVASVMLRGGTNVPTKLAMLTEGGASIGGKMGNDLGSSGGDRSTVEVEKSKEGGVRRERRMDAGGTKEVKGQDGLGKETVPFGEGEGRIGGAEDGDEVIFERPDGTFGGVGTMFFRRDTLIVNVVFVKCIF
jgi:hypothetical protein